MTTDATIRLTTAADLPPLQSIELAAGELFREIGMADIAEHPPPSIEALERYRRAGLSWVAVGPDDQPLAFVLVDLVDGAAHVEQVSVHPEHGRRGIGRLLIDEVARWAVAQGLPALTLSTFRSVPWNGPYYARLGFRELAAGELTSGLTTIQRHEAALGLAPTERLFMRREIETDSVSG